MPFILHEDKMVLRPIKSSVNMNKK